MPAQLIDGNLLSKKLRAEIATRSAILTAKGVRPGLAVIVVGDDPASQVYRARCDWFDNESALGQTKAAL